jgi:hypothetical protein
MAPKIFIVAILAALAAAQIPDVPQWYVIYHPVSSQNTNTMDFSGSGVMLPAISSSGCGFTGMYSPPVRQVKTTNSRVQTAGASARILHSLTP